MNNLNPVLLIEDDLVDIMTVKRCFKQLKITDQLLIANNGEEAIDLLKNPATALPCIILLDINMPKMNGLEFLKQFKQIPILRKIPVVILTSSRESSDIDHCFTYGASGYLLKPVAYDEFVKTIQLFDQYWTHNELPS